MRTDEQLDIFRDDPQRLLELWRVQAETSRQQFPNWKWRDEYYRKEIEKLEQHA